MLGAGFSASLVLETGLTLDGFFIYEALFAFRTPHGLTGLAFETRFALDDFSVDIANLAPRTPRRAAFFARFAGRTRVCRLVRSFPVTRLGVISVVIRMPVRTVIMRCCLAGATGKTKCAQSAGQKEVHYEFRGDFIHRGLV